MTTNTFKIVLKSGNSIEQTYESEAALMDTVGSLIMFGFQINDEDGNNVFVPSHQIKFINLGSEKISGENIIKINGLIDTENFL